MREEKKPGPKQRAQQAGEIRQVCGHAGNVSGSICGLSEKVHEFAGHEYVNALVVVGVGKVEVQCPGQVTIDEALRAEIEAESGGGEGEVEVVAAFEVGGQ